MKGGNPLLYGIGAAALIGIGALMYKTSGQMINPNPDGSNS